MRNRALCWVIALLPLLFPSGSYVGLSQADELPQEGTLVLGLRQAAEMATGLLDRTGPQIARWKVKEEEGKLWPELSFRGRYSLDKSNVIESQGGAIAGGGAGEEIQRYRSELVLSYNLLQFLESVPRIEEAKSNERSSFFRHIQEQGETILRVSDSYLAFLSRQEALESLETLRLDQLAFVRKQEAKFSDNLIPSTELLRAQGDLISLERDILSLRGELAAAELNLRRLTGLKPDQSIILAFDPRELELDLIRKEGVGALLALAKEANPRLLAAQAAAESARSGAEAAEAQRYPTLVASAGYGFGRETILSETTNIKTTDTRTSVGITLTFPLFDGGVRQARITQANLRAESQRSELRRTAEEIKSLIESEYWAFVEREQNKELLERQLQLANDEFRQARLRAEAGIGPTGETLAALSKVARLQRELARAKAEALFRGIRLALAVGRSPFTQSLPSPALPAETLPHLAPASPSPATQIAMKISSTEAQPASAEADGRPETREAPPPSAAPPAASPPGKIQAETIEPSAAPPPRPEGEMIETASQKLESKSLEPAVLPDLPAQPYEAAANIDGHDAPEKAAPGPKAPTSRLFKGIRVSKEDGSTTVFILADGRIEHYAVFQLYKPLRFVIDLQKTVEAGRNVHRQLPVNTSQLKQIRIGRHPEKIRIVLDLAQDGETRQRIVQRDDGLQVILGEAP